MDIKLAWKKFPKKLIITKEANVKDLHIVILFFISSLK